MKLLLPVFWFIFFGGLTLILFFEDLEHIKEPLTPNTARMLMVSFFVSTAGLYYLLFARIKWVAMDSERLYVSNFFKSLQYTYDSIAKVEETKVLFWQKVTLHFHQSTQFGTSIVFINSYYWYYFLKQHPEILKQLAGATLEQEGDSKP
jgi:hypothetical protein